MFDILKYNDWDSEAPRAVRVSEFVRNEKTAILSRVYRLVRPPRYHHGREDVGHWLRTCRQQPPPPRIEPPQRAQQEELTLWSRLCHCASIFGLEHLSRQLSPALVFLQARCSEQRPRLGPRGSPVLRIGPRKGRCCGRGRCRRCVRPLRVKGNSRQFQAPRSLGASSRQRVAIAISFSIAIQNSKRGI
jgi:hypothetical protein